MWLVTEFCFLRSPSERALLASIEMNTARRVKTRYLNRSFNKSWTQNIAKQMTPNSRTKLRHKNRCHGPACFLLKPSVWPDDGSKSIQNVPIVAQKRNISGIFLKIDILQNSPESCPKFGLLNNKICCKEKLPNLVTLKAIKIKNEDILNESTDVVDVVVVVVVVDVGEGRYHLMNSTQFHTDLLSSSIISAWFGIRRIDTICCFEANA